MKKNLFIVASALFVVSCNDVADNEYKIEGKIDPSYNGKSVFLEKPADFMGTVPVDTAKVEDGRFVFSDTVSKPSFYFVSLDGKPSEKLRVILEPGEIEIEVDKDTIYNSKIGGTYNNEKFYEYSKEAKALRKAQSKNRADFIAKNKAEIDAVTASMDTAAMNKLQNKFIEQYPDIKNKPLNFVKENPKAYISLFLLGDMLSGRLVKPAEAKELYEGLDAEVKNTKEGKELAKAIEDALNPKAATEQPQAQPTAGNAAVGQMAPLFSAPNPEGKMVSLKESMGKVTVIDFWASWCKPCRIENPHVVAMYNELHPKGLNIIGVSLDKPGKADAWKKAIADDKLTWSQVSNLQEWQEPIARMYGVNSIPATFVLDANGKIVAKNLRGDALKAKVEELLNAK